MQICGCPSVLGFTELSTRWSILPSFLRLVAVNLEMVAINNLLAAMRRIPMSWQGLISHLNNSNNSSNSNLNILKVNQFSNKSLTTA